MRPRRSFLFWGLLLIPLGAIPLLVRAGVIDPTRLIDAWRLWPLLLIGIGVVILIGRTRAALVGTAVIALTLGSIAGAALASTGDWIGFVADCGPGGPTQQLDRTGSLSGNATVSLDLRCGNLDVKATGDAGWSVAAKYGGNPPTIEAGSDRLDVRTASGSGHQRDEWTIRVPSAQLGALAVTANAAASELDLGPATMNRLDVDVNAGDVRIVAGSGGTNDADITMNAGRLRLETGAAPMTGRIAINAGAIDLCVPADVGLRLDVTDQLTFVTNLSSQGLDRSGTVWTRSAAGVAPTIDLAIEGNAASLTLKGEGACR